MKRSNQEKSCHGRAHCNNTDPIHKRNETTTWHTSPIRENEPDHHRAIQRCSTTTIQGKTPS